MIESEWLSSTDPAAMLAWVTGPVVELPALAVKARAPSDRQLRLFVAAVESRWWGQRTISGDRDSIRLLEAIADGKASMDSWHKIAFSYTLPRGAADCARECVRIHNSLGDTPQWAALLREIFGNPFRPVALDPAWLTPTVKALAAVAYEERPGRKCEKCYGKGKWKRCNGCHGEWAGDVGPDCFVCGHPYLTNKQCPDCNGTGHISDGSLCHGNLGVLCDALTEAGCPLEVECEKCKGEGSVPHYSGMYQMGTDLCRSCNGAGRVPHAVLAHLRSPGPHIRGCWGLDPCLEKR